MLVGPSLCDGHIKGKRSRSLEKGLFLPLLRIKPHKDVVGLHFHPTHFVCNIRPALRFEELGGAELGPVIGHVVEHVEEYRVWKGLDCLLGKSFWFAHVIALWHSNVHLETFLIVAVTKLLGCCTSA